jgi:membrane-bound inhibitor of C-type lysozyme
VISEEVVPDVEYNHYVFSIPDLLVLDGRQYEKFLKETMEKQLGEPVEIQFAQASQGLLDASKYLTPNARVILRNTATAKVPILERYENLPIWPEGESLSEKIVYVKYLLASQLRRIIRKIIPFSVIAALLAKDAMEKRYGVESDFDAIFDSVDEEIDLEEPKPSLLDRALSLLNSIKSSVFRKFNMLLAKADKHLSFTTDDLEARNGVHRSITRYSLMAIKCSDDTLALAGAQLSSFINKNQNSLVAKLSDVQLLRLDDTIGKSSNSYAMFFYGFYSGSFASEVSEQKSDKFSNPELGILMKEDGEIGRDLTNSSALKINRIEVLKSNTMSEFFAQAAVPPASFKGIADD